MRSSTEGFVPLDTQLSAFTSFAESLRDSDSPIGGFVVAGFTPEGEFHFQQYHMCERKRALASALVAACALPESGIDLLREFLREVAAEHLDTLQKEIDMIIQTKTCKE